MGVLAVAHILGFDELSVEGARVAAGFSTCRCRQLGAQVIGDGAVVGGSVFIGLYG